jgi:L,D-peptidoglycan transpeptidase YkuD (ErfK/YbiS/YcfS/YnhG family)
VSKTITYLHVFAINACSPVGRLVIGGLSFPCLLGRNGRTFLKREGDGKSPKGKWRLERLYYRPDKLRHFSSSIKAAPLKKSQAWCDAKGHKDYNRQVRLPFSASHEEMWRNDAAYDLVITTNHNQRPRVQGLGSAIFLHVWHKGAKGTAGCVALKSADLTKVLARCSGRSYLVI